MIKFKKYFKQRLEELFIGSLTDTKERITISTHDVTKMKLRDGKDIFYVKFSDKDRYDVPDDSELHTLVEYLAYKIYRHFKIRVPNAELVTGGRRLGLASKEVRGNHVGYEQLIDNVNIAEGFYVDVLMANWDMPGTGGWEAPNILIDEKKNAYRIDPGGALTFRAQGGRKGSLFSDEPGEIDTFCDPEHPGPCKEIFAFANIKPSEKKFSSVSWSSLNRMLDSENNSIINELNKGHTKLLPKWNKEFKMIKSKMKTRFEYISDIIDNIE